MSAIVFPSTDLIPNVTTHTVGDITWIWNGIGWDKQGGGGGLVFSVDGMTGSINLSTSYEAFGAVDAHEMTFDHAAFLTSVGVSDIVATGTPDTSTVLYGDGRWDTPPGGGGLTYPGGASSFLRSDGEWTNWIGGGVVAGDPDLTSNWRSITYTCTAGTTTITADPDTFSAADDGKVIRSTTFGNLPWDARLVWTGSTSSIDFDSPSGGVTVGTGDTALVGAYRYAANFESRLDDLFIGHTSTLLPGNAAVFRDSVAMHFRVNHTWDTNPNSSMDSFAIGPPGLIEIDGLVRIGENAPPKDNFGGSSFNTARTYRNIRGQVARPGGILYGTTFSDHFQADQDELYVYQAMGPVNNVTLHSINGGSVFGGRVIDLQPGEDFVRPGNTAAPYWTAGTSAQLGMWLGVQSAPPTVTGDSGDGVVDKTVGFDHGGLAWRSLGADLRIVEGSDIIYAEDGTKRTITGVDITTAGAVLHKAGAFSAADEGLYVSGSGIAPGTYIATFTDAGNVVLSELATVSTGIAVQISGEPAFAFSADDIGLGIGNDSFSGPSRDSIDNLGWKVFIVELLDEQADGTASQARVSAIGRSTDATPLDPGGWAYHAIAVENNFGTPNYSNARIAYGVRTADPIKLFDTGNKSVRGTAGSDTSVWFDLAGINFIEADGQYRSTSTKGPRFLRWNPSIRMSDNADTSGGNLAFWLTPTIETDPDADSAITTLGASYGMLYSPKLIANGHTGVGLNGLGIYNRPALSVLNSGTIVSGVVTGFHSLADVGAGVSGVTRYGLRISEATGSGSLYDQYGIWVDAMTKGAHSNHAAYLAGTTVDGYGNVTVAGSLTAATMSGDTTSDGDFVAASFTGLGSVTAVAGLYSDTLSVTGLATIETLLIEDPAGIGGFSSTNSAYGPSLRSYKSVADRTGGLYPTTSLGFSTLFAPDSGFLGLGPGGSTAIDAYLMRYASKTMRMQSSVTSDTRDAIFQVDGAIQPLGLTGATSASRYVGAVRGGSPAWGTWSVGDWALDVSDGSIWVCTVAGTPGTPGTWTQNTTGGAAPDLTDYMALDGTYNYLTGGFGFLRIYSEDDTYAPQLYIGHDRSDAQAINSLLGAIVFQGSKDGTTGGMNIGAYVQGKADEAWNGTAAGGRFEIATTAATTTTAYIRSIFDNAGGFYLGNPTGATTSTTKTNAQFYVARDGSLQIGTFASPKFTVGGTTGNVAVGGTLDVTGNLTSIGRTIFGATDVVPGAGATLATTASYVRCAPTTARTIAVVSTTSAVAGQLFTIENTATFNLTITTGGSSNVKLLDGVNRILTQYQTLTLIFDGTYWCELGTWSTNLQTLSAVTPSTLGLALLAATSRTTNGVLIGNGTGVPAVTAVGTTGQYLTGVTGSAPVWGTIDVADVANAAVTDYVKQTDVNSASSPTTAFSYTLTADDLSVNGDAVEIEIIFTSANMSGRNVSFTLAIDCPSAPSTQNVATGTITTAGTVHHFLRATILRTSSTGGESGCSIASSTAHTGTLPTVSYISWGSQTGMWSTDRTITLTIQNSSGSAADLTVRNARIKVVPTSTSAV